MNFKKGDTVFVSEENLKKMLIPASEGPLFVLRNRTDTGLKPYWEMTNKYIIMEEMLQRPTKLIKALL